MKEFEQLSAKVKWQYFEKLVAWIFEQNGYETKQNAVIVKGKKKHQFDVIARLYGTTYVVECKKWKSKSRLGAMKNAAKKHAERCDFYGPCSPLIVILTDDQILPMHGIPIVPISKLNWFINNPSAPEE